LIRNKAYSIINIVGFAVGLATTLVIFLYIRHETTFDKHLSKKEHLYRIIRKEHSASGTVYNNSFPFPFARTLENGIDPSNEVIRVFFSSPRAVQLEDNTYPEKGILFVDATFIKAFDVKILKGNPKILNQGNVVFLSESLAKKYFGKQNPIGREIRLDNLHLSVAGIIKEPKRETHIPYKMLVSYKSLNPGFVGTDYNTWDFTILQSKCYILLGKNAHKGDIEHRIREIYHKHAPPEDHQLNIELQPVTNIHLDTRFTPYSNYENTYTNSRELLWIYISIAILVMIIALINFINISLAQALSRSRDIAMRKVLGASRKKLIIQFLLETSLVVISAGILAIILLEIFLPLINIQLGPMIRLSLYGAWETVVFLVAIIILVSLLAGIIPAWFMSKSRPIEAMRKNFYLKKKRKSVPGYKFLVTTEFIISQVLLIALIIIQSQIDYMHKKNPGFEKENIVRIILPRTDTLGKEDLKTDLLDHPNISHVSLSFDVPTDPDLKWSFDFTLPGNQQKYRSNVKFTDLDYLETFNIRLIAGRWLHHSNKQQSIDKQIVVNEQFVKMIGFSHPDSVIGKWIRLNIPYKQSHPNKKLKVIGVTEDFHIRSLRDNLSPVMLYYYPPNFFQASVRMEKSHYKETLRYMRECYERHISGRAFSYRIYEQDMKALYAEEERNYNLLKYFSIIAVILAIMGLYGLVSFMVVKKTREIGIRKANGATTGGIIKMYIFSYLKFIFLASIPAWPVAYHLMNRWLRDYAYHIKLTIEYFIAGLLIIVLIALFTILFQTLKTANTNPAQTLRDE
jgi:ABC-type antimicrobial peptide transport system permease subunit